MTSKVEQQLRDAQAELERQRVGMTKDIRGELEKLRLENRALLKIQKLPEQAGPAGETIIQEAMRLRRENVLLRGARKHTTTRPKPAKRKVGRGPASEPNGYTPRAKAANSRGGQLTPDARIHGGAGSPSASDDFEKDPISGALLFPGSEELRRISRKWNLRRRQEVADDQERSER